MARVKTARITRKKHKKILKQAKGYYGKTSCYEIWNVCIHR